MVLLLPPAPAALVELGLAFAIFSFWSAAARRRMAVRGPPGGVGEEGRATLAPEAAPTAWPVGEEARGEDCRRDEHETLAFLLSRFPRTDMEAQPAKADPTPNNSFRIISFARRRAHWLS